MKSILTFPKCPICEFEKTVFFQIFEQTKFFRCPNCTCIFISKSSYQGDPRKQYETNETAYTEYYLSSKNIDSENFERTIELIERLQNFKNKKGSILDVGTNIGTFLECAQRSGWECSGIEPNPKALTIANKNELNVESGFFDERWVEHTKSVGKKFDVIHMGDVIEHVFEPCEFLKSANKLLSLKGYIVIVTPDIDSYFAKLFQFKPKEHLVYFNKKSMEIALKKSGFLPISIKSQRRLRDLANVKRGTTKLGFFSRVISLLAGIPLLGYILNHIALFLIKDELFVIAQKIDTTN